MTTLDLIAPNDWNEYVETDWQQEAFSYSTTADAYDEVSAGQGVTDTPVTDHDPGTVLITVAVAAILVLTAVAGVVITVIKKKKGDTDETI